MIQIENTVEKTYDEILHEVYKALHAEARNTKTWGITEGECDQITEWAWDRYTTPKGDAVAFEAPYDTWDEMLDAYREEKFSQYEESRIG